MHLACLARCDSEHKSRIFIQVALGLDSPFNSNANKQNEIRRTPYPDQAFLSSKSLRPDSPNNALADGSCRSLPAIPEAAHDEVNDQDDQMPTTSYQATSMTFVRPETDQRTLTSQGLYKSETFAKRSLSPGSSSKRLAVEDPVLGSLIKLAMNKDEDLRSRLSTYTYTTSRRSTCQSEPLQWLSGSPRKSSLPAQPRLEFSSRRASAPLHRLQIAESKSID